MYIGLQTQIIANQIYSKAENSVKRGEKRFGSIVGFLLVGRQVIEELQHWSVWGQRTNIPHASMHEAVIVKQTIT
jgi:hypothetical protein